MVALLLLLMQVPPVGDVAAPAESTALTETSSSDRVYLDSLYGYASTLLVKFEAEKESARKVFIGTGAPAVAYLTPKFDTKSASEMSALEEMLKRMGRPALAGIIANLDYRGSDEEARALRLSLRILSETHKYDTTLSGPATAAAAARFATDPDWRVRSASATALAYSRTRDALPALLTLARDSIGLVRKSATFGIANLAKPGDIPVLLGLLGDEFYGVRYAASDGLAKIGRPAVDSLAARQRYVVDPVFQSLLIRTLGKIKNDAAQKVLKRWLDDPSPLVRLAVYEAITDSAILAKRLRKETNPLLKNYLRTKAGSHF